MPLTQIIREIWSPALVWILWARQVFTIAMSWHNCVTCDVLACMHSRAPQNWFVLEWESVYFVCKAPILMGSRTWVCRDKSMSFRPQQAGISSVQGSSATCESPVSHWLLIQKRLGATANRIGPRSPLFNPLKAQTFNECFPILWGSSTINQILLLDQNFSASFPKW